MSQFNANPLSVPIANTCPVLCVIIPSCDCSSFTLVLLTQVMNADAAYEIPTSAVYVQSGAAYHFCGQL